ncbi:MAG: Serine-tRNA ligase [Microgenomates group bacterium GW2011_GWC1_37_8]|nr:MAG: Serine-tRNA ligase [Microgenomates group bacterium GW2011_GWC1_37_8]
MIDIELLRTDPEKIKKGVADKQFDPAMVDTVLALDEKRRKLMQEVQELQAERNRFAKEKNVEEGKRVKEELKKIEPELEKAEKEFEEKLNLIPNPPLPSVPVGKNETENVEVRKWGEPRKFEFELKDHLELGKALGILDFETGAKVAGSQFYFLYGDGALLELALIQYAFELLSKEGFKPVITPDLAKSRYYLGTGYMPKGNEAQTYTIEGEDLGLIATAEVTLAGKHADEVIPEEKLPLKYIGYSHCFRQEAGAYGKYSKGLYRVHEFTKAEMFIYCTPEESEKHHQLILEMEERIYQNLGLPYRVLEMCAGDLGAMAAKKYDIEAWMPTRGEYGEVTSTSNCTDYQARNLNIKYRSKQGKNDYVHMLNGTAIATSRTPLAILENYQQADGSVVIPEVLRKWMGKERIDIGSK